MPGLTPRRAVRIHRIPPPRGSLYPPGCPLTLNHQLNCLRLCKPRDGMGDCGRVAPHAFLGRTQLAILEHRRRRG